jgi:hypothetical protein
MSSSDSELLKASVKPVTPKNKKSEKGNEAISGTSRRLSSENLNAVGDNSYGAPHRGGKRPGSLEGCPAISGRETWFLSHYLFQNFAKLRRTTSRRTRTPRATWPWASKPLPTPPGDF